MCVRVDAHIIIIYIFLFTKTCACWTCKIWIMIFLKFPLVSDSQIHIYMCIHQIYTHVYMCMYVCKNYLKKRRKTFGLFTINTFYIGFSYEWNLHSQWNLYFPFMCNLKGEESQLCSLSCVLMLWSSRNRTLKFMKILLGCLLCKVHVMCRPLWLIRILFRASFFLVNFVSLSLIVIVISSALCFMSKSLDNSSFLLYFLLHLLLEFDWWHIQV